MIAGKKTKSAKVKRTTPNRPGSKRRPASRARRSGLTARDLASFRKLLLEKAAMTRA